MTLPNYQSHDRERAITGASQAIAEYLFAYPKSAKLQDLLLEVEYVAEVCLAEMVHEAARERALEEKADRLGLKY